MVSSYYMLQSFQLQCTLHKGCLANRAVSSGICPIGGTVWLTRDHRAGSTTCAAGSVCTALNDCTCLLSINFDACVPAHIAERRRRRVELCTHRLLAVHSRVRCHKHRSEHQPHPYHNGYGPGAAQHDIQRCNANWVPDPCRRGSCVPLLPPKQRCDICIALLTLAGAGPWLCLSLEAKRGTGRGSPA